MDDTFLESLLDITNRLWVDRKLFEQQDGQDRDDKIKFVRNLDPNDQSRLDGAKAVKDSGIDPREATWQALLRIFKIELTSGFLSDGKQQRDHCAGITQTWNTYPPGSSLIVRIDCELVWPLINDTYSNSEKLKAGLILGTTIAHEMMVSHSRDIYTYLFPANSMTAFVFQCSCQVVNRSGLDWDSST
jgi:hypothetical protein